MNRLIAQLTHRPFPELADVLRACEPHITREWSEAVREAMPRMQHLTFDQLRDSTPEILMAIADALASDDPEVIVGLVDRAPAQGLSRLAMNLGVVDVMQEDRLLRAIIVQHVEIGLGRRMDVPESAALHAAIDIMLQYSVIALVEKQKIELRSAAETELKFLSFLSHDLSNNLASATTWLQVLAAELKASGGYDAARETLEQSQDAIRCTFDGMQRLLDHARLRQASVTTSSVKIDLHEMAREVAGQIAREASEKGVAIEVTVPYGALIHSDRDLIRIVLQNLVGNAVKYSTKGTVRMGCNQATKPCRRVLSVSDEGPGIAPEKIGQIFDAFRRGDVHGQPGVGLGLAIASQAAKLLNAHLTVESEVGVGSTFKLHLTICSASRCIASTKREAVSS